MRLGQVYLACPSHCNCVPGTFTPVQVVYPDRLLAIMQSPHPAVLSDGRMVNFSRVFPFGGSHLYRQDRVTLHMKEVRVGAFMRRPGLLVPFRCAVPALCDTPGKHSEERCVTYAACW